MNRLSNAELRVLFIRRLFLEDFIPGAAFYLQEDNWSEYLERMNAVRDEIKAIVKDPQFDLLVRKPKMSRTGPNSFSGSGTILNVVSSARELFAYINGVFALHDSPKLQELKQARAASGNVFIGHGRNEIVRSKVKDFIRDRCLLQPLVLQEMASSGLTVIEKLERYGRLADYAVLLFTGDDIIAENDVKRSRQNVIQELGWFQGTIGRNRTAILMQRGVEIPSNISGVVYLEFNDNDVEMTFEALRKEFEDVGLIDPPLKLRARG